ncbi:MAG: TonB-dependent receptor [Myxococcales bacterium FL481]|nr:MAG: TonB-dependent receptor [Myxococcales bacterium FL481]
MDLAMLFGACLIGPLWLLAPLASPSASAPADSPRNRSGRANPESRPAVEDAAAKPRAGSAPPRHRAGRPDVESGEAMEGPASPRSRAGRADSEWREAMEDAAAGSRNGSAVDPRVAPQRGATAGSDRRADRSEPPRTRGGYRTVVSDHGATPAETQHNLDLDTPGFATAVVIDVADPTLRGDDLGERLDRQSGVVTRSMGGLGQYSSVSLRGSSPQQVPVFVDGVPVDGAIAGLVDLASLPLDPVQRIEVYRGYVPVAFGRGGVGGAINLVGRMHRGPTRLQAKAGYGSFRARHAMTSLSGSLGRGASGMVTVGYAGAKGDFPYFDNNGTPVFTGDDTTSRRSNNGYDRLSALLRLDGRRAGWRYSSQLFVLGQTRGVPGSATVQSTQTSDTTLRLRSVSSVRRRFGRPGGRVTWVGGGTFETRRYRDPLGEVGLAVDDERGHSFDGYLSPRIRLPLWRGAFVGVVADARGEEVIIDERVLMPGASHTGDAVRRRASIGAGLELEQFAWSRRIHVVPAVRLDALVNRFRVAPGDGELTDEAVDSDVVAASPRLGARLRITAAWSLRASGGRYLRPPTLMEMFGDRGYIVGNEGLEPERGTSADAGFVYDAAWAAIARVYAHVAGFALWNKDGIQWRQTGVVVRPENVAASRIRGIESSLRIAAWRERITLQAAYTWLDSADLSPEPARHGRPLPGRPRHDLWLTASLGHRFVRARWQWAPRVRYSVEHVAGTFLDPSGRFGLPPRTLHGVGVELRVAERLQAGVDVRNLADVRVAQIVPQAGPPTPYPVPVSDFLAYPLPGRSVWLSVGVTLGPASSRPTREG